MNTFSMNLFRAGSKCGINSQCTCSWQPGEKVVSYLARPVDSSVDFEGTTSVHPSQTISGNTFLGNAQSLSSGNRLAPRMPVVGVRMAPGGGMQPFNLPPHVGLAGLNPSGVPIQRAASHQVHQQQLRRKDQGLGMQNPSYPPQQKSKRY